MALKEYELVRMLEIPETGVIDMVLDTDAYTEVDDPFAIAYALLSPERVNLLALYAAPFAMNERAQDPADGMEMSYGEILNILNLCHTQRPVYRGSTRYLADKGEPVDSPAARDLIERSKGYDKEHPLYVVAIGAITNVASALLMDETLCERIVVVYLGGNDLDLHPNTYNIYQDVKAAQVVFDCGVPLIHMPCDPVSRQLITGMPELRACIGGRNALCDYLVRIVGEYGADHFAWGKTIWDISAIALLVNPGWTRSGLTTSPIITDQLTWSRDITRHLIRNVASLDRDAIFRDVFRKLAGVRD